MKKLTLIITIVFSGILMQAQSHTYSNNMGTNYMYGKTDNLKKSSISWTFKNASNGIYSITATYAGSFNVKYSHYDSANKLYVYVPTGSAKFDGATIKLCQPENLATMLMGLPHRVKMYLVWCSPITQATSTLYLIDLNMNSPMI